MNPKAIFGVRPREQYRTLEGTGASIKNLVEIAHKQFRGTLPLINRSSLRDLVWVLLSERILAPTAVSADPNQVAEVIQARGPVRPQPLLRTPPIGA